MVALVPVHVALTKMILLHDVTCECEGCHSLRSLVLDAVKQNGGAFAYADPSLHADRGGRLAGDFGIHGKMRGWGRKVSHQAAQFLDATFFFSLNS